MGRTSSEFGLVHLARVFFRTPRRRKTKRSRRSGRGRGSAPGSGSRLAVSNVTRVRFIVASFNVQKVNAQLGIYNPEQSASSFASSAAIFFSPVDVGGRFYTVAQMFLEWKVNSARLRYKPVINPVGLTAITGSGTTTPSYIGLPFVFGWSRDGSVFPVNYDFAIEGGGVQCTSTRSAVVNIPPSGWKYVVPTTGTATYADTRLETHGVFFGYFEAAPSATSSLPLGIIQVELDVSFRGPIGSNAESSFLQEAIASRYKLLSSISKRLVIPKPHRVVDIGRGFDPGDVKQE